MDNNKSQLIDLWRTSFQRQRRIYQTILRSGLQKRKRPVYREKTEKSFPPFKLLPYVMTYYGKENIRKL